MQYLVSRSAGGAIRCGVVLLAVLTAIVVGVRLPGLVTDLEEEAARNSALSYSDREVAGGNGVVADQRAVYAARSLIPEDEAFHVAVGADYRGGTDLTAPYVESFFQYFLMPRRPADDARWVVCYGCDVVETRPGASVLWRGQNRISIVRLPQ